MVNRKTVAHILSATTLLLLSGCSVVRNADREAFDNKAVKQAPANGFTCEIHSENELHTHDSNETLIEIACGNATFTTTIVRVSR